MLGVLLALGAALAADPEASDRDTCQVGARSVVLELRPKQPLQGPEDYYLDLIEGGTRTAVRKQDGSTLGGWLLSGIKGTACRKVSAFEIGGLILFFVGEFGGEPNNVVTAVLYDARSHRQLDYRQVSMGWGRLLQQSNEAVTLLSDRAAGGGAGAPGPPETLHDGEVVTPSGRAINARVLVVTVEKGKIAVHVDLERTFRSSEAGRWFKSGDEFVRAFGLTGTADGPDDEDPYWVGRAASGRHCISPRGGRATTRRWYCEP